MECCCCFTGFAKDLLKIANAGSVNAVHVLVVCNEFERNSALSNGFQETPYKRGFLLFIRF